MKKLLTFKRGLLTAFIVLISLASSIAVEVTVNFNNSLGDPIEGATVKYYDYINGGWHILGLTNSIGQVFGDIPTQGSGFSSIRLIYQGTSERIYQNVLNNNVFNFNTVLVTFKFLNSGGNEIDAENARFNGSVWKTFGDGTANESMELLGREYLFEVSFDGKTNQKLQDVTVDPIIIFQTANVTLYFTGSIEYGSGGWKAFNGPSIELLPSIHNFRFSGVGYLNVDQSINVTATGIEKTVEYVKLTSSQGNGIENAATQYNSSAWNAGTMTNTNGSCINLIEGMVSNVTTRLYHGGTYKDVAQNIFDDSFVDFNTVSVSMNLLNSDSIALESSNAEYYANGWQVFGDGVTSESIELLPQDYNFRVSYAGGSETKHQDISSDANVVFETLPVTVNLFNSNGNALTSENVIYSNDGNNWMQFGSGITPQTIELLTDDYTFRPLYAGATIDKDQNVGDDAVVNFATIPVTMNIYNAIGNVLNGTDATYDFAGSTIFGDGSTPSVMELLPVTYDFGAMYNDNAYASTQNTAINPNVSFNELAAPAGLLDVSQEESLDFENIIESSIIIIKEASDPIESMENDDSFSVYPNPFSNQITLNYTLDKESLVSIKIYDLNGTLINVLMDANKNKGQYQIEWNGTDAMGNQVPSGMYLYSVTINNKTKSKTIILQK
jgi:hypothetical protein